MTDNVRDAREFLRELQQVAAKDRLERAEWERDVAARAYEEELAIMLRRQAAEQEWEFAGRCDRHGTPLLGDSTCLECEAEAADERRTDA